VCSGDPRHHGLSRLEQGATCALPNLRPSTKSISLRLPLSLLERIKVAVPYQSLIKVWLAEKADAE
jgi:predicted DNA binding CopG/RHH family protein